MQDRALDHALEPGGRLWIRLFLRFQRLVFLIEILAHDVAQIAQVHTARLHHLRRIGIVDQREQQMFESCVFVAALRSIGERGMKRLFKALCKTGHGRRSSVRQSGQEGPGAGWSPEVGTSVQNRCMPG